MMAGICLLAAVGREGIVLEHRFGVERLFDGRFTYIGLSGGVYKTAARK